MLAAMKIRLASTALALLALPGLAAAQQAGEMQPTKSLTVTLPAMPPAPNAQGVIEDLVKVELQTEKGRIVLALDRGRAPITAKNFLRYVEAGRFDGQTFYRAMPYGDTGLIQGGVTDDIRKLYPPIAHEPTDETGLSHKAGTISMGHVGAGTARADFFILLGDMIGLDASDDPGMDPVGFAAFGHVVEGMDVVKAIFEQPIDPSKGEGAMKGQMLAKPVKIVKARTVK